MADHDDDGDDGETMTSTATTKTMRPMIMTLITTIAWFVILVENVMENVVENVTVFANATPSWRCVLDSLCFGRDCLIHCAMNRDITCNKFMSITIRVHDRCVTPGNIHNDKKPCT